MTPPIDPYVVNTKSIGLKNIHETIFTKMAMCNHRVVAIERQTTSKFKVTTNCCATDWSHNTQNCRGEVQFNLKKKGPYVFLATFEHSDKCKRYNPNLPSGIFEDLPCDIEDFATRWPTYISNAASFAEIDCEVKRARRQEEIDSGHDVVCTPFELKESNKIYDGIGELANQMAEFYSSQATGEGTTS